MENGATSSPTAWRAIASGLLIAIAGPPLGAIVVFFMVAGSAFLSGETPGSVYLIGSVLVKMTLASYIFGGPAALLAGVIVGIALYRGVWFSWTRWFVLTIGLSLAAILAFAVVIGDMSGAPALFLFLAPTTFAAFVLRALIVRFGWMRRSTGPADGFAD